MADNKKMAKAADRRSRKKAPVQMTVRHAFVGTKTVTDAFIPIIYEDIRRTVGGADTLDTEGISA